MMALTLALFTLALAALALGVVVMTALRLSRKRDELAEELRATRTRMQTLAELLDVWSWRSDADHRVIAMQPPHGAATSDWSGAPLPQPIWERFSAEHAVGLRAQLTSGAVLHDVPVMLGEKRRALLRGRPVRDAQGLFAGYQGTLREIVVAATTVPMLHAGASTIAAAPSVATKAVSGTSDHDTFSFTVSHDLRAPIRVVQGLPKTVQGA